MRYVKTSSGLSVKDTPKIQVYSDDEKVCNAIEDGTLCKGELFAIPLTYGVFCDLSEEVAAIKSLIPNSASITNLLVTQLQLTCATDITLLCNRVCSLESTVATNTSNISTNSSYISQIASVIPSNATDTNKLVTNSTLSSSVETLNTTIANLTDYVNGTTICGRIDTNESNISSLRTALAATNTTLATKVSSSTYTTDMNNMSQVISNNFDTLNCCKVECCDFEAYQNDVINPALTNATCSFQALGDNIYNLCVCVSSLSQCSGLDCVGTVLDCDLDYLRNDIGDLSSCPGLLCTGSLNESDLAQICLDITNLYTCPGISCTGTLVASDLDSICTSIACLESCPGLSCTGTLTESSLTTIRCNIDCLLSCPGLSCTGTLVESDLDGLSSRVSALEGCDGLNCVGTLTDTDFQTLLNCISSLESRIQSLESCPGLNCTGTSVATFSLSGTTLTITE